MTPIALITALFMMGLLGSPHCLGMCGGIVTAFGLSLGQVSAARKKGLIATYHFGRLCSYMALGALASGFGSALLQPFAMSKLPRIMLGLALMLVALMLLGLPILNRLERVGARLWQVMAPLRQKVFPLTTFPKALRAGLLWGLLPCGLVYGAILLALSISLSNNTTLAVLGMLAFGVGTLPMLVFAQGVVLWLQRTIRRFALRKVSGTILLLSGVSVIAPMLLPHDHHNHHAMPPDTVPTAPMTNHHNHSDTTAPTAHHHSH